MIDPPLGARPFRTAIVCPMCRFGEKAVFDRSLKTVNCCYCDAPRQEYKYLSTHERCRSCAAKDVIAELVEGQIRARCANCLADRQYLDRERYGSVFGIAPANPTRRPSRLQPSESARERSKEIAKVGCVHCALRDLGVQPRYTVIPAQFRSPAPPVQISIMQALLPHGLSEPPKSIDEFIAFHDDDHILSITIYRRIGPTSPEEAERKMRSEWIVPSCPACNQRRKGKLENIGYLIQVFGFYLNARSLEPHEEAYEANLFIETAKIAHLHLRYESEFSKTVKEHA